MRRNLSIRALYAESDKTTLNHSYDNRYLFTKSAQSERGTSNKIGERLIDKRHQVKKRKYFKLPSYKSGVFNFASNSQTVRYEVITENE